MVAEAILDRVLVAMTDVEAEVVSLTNPSGENSDVVCEAWKDRTTTQIWMAKQYKRIRKAAKDRTVLRHDLFARVSCLLYDDRSTSSPKNDLSLTPTGTAIKAANPPADRWLSEHARSNLNQALSSLLDCVPVCCFGAGAGTSGGAALPLCTVPMSFRRRLFLRRRENIVAVVTEL